MSNISKTNRNMIFDCNVQKPSLLLVKAISEDSNRELDWLWYADHVKTVEERCYCLNRALYISPNNIRVQMALRDAHHQRRSSENVTAKGGESNLLSRVSRLLNTGN